MSCTCTAEELAELAALQALYDALTAGILAVAGGAASYTLDTGQSRQTVTKATLSEFRLLRNDIRDELQILKDRCAGRGGSVYVRPAF
jgi:hypothetical protein